MARILLALLFVLTPGLFSCVSHSEMCVATVVHAGGNGNRCVIEYHVEGQRFSAYGPRMRYLAVGERFQLLYNKQQPWKHKLIVDKPVFLANEPTACVEGRVLRCVNGTFTRVIFSYEVNGKHYKKSQVITGPQGIRKDNSCVVKFSVGDPARAVFGSGND